MARGLNLWEKAKLLELNPDKAVVTEVPTPRPPDVVMRVTAPEPPEKCGEAVWWKCTRCWRYYDAEHKTTSGMCGLCEFRQLQRKAAERPIATEW